MLLRRSLAAVTFCAATITLTGCMLSPTATPSAEPAVLGGTVHGGQTPVTGARIFVFEATSAGYGKASMSDISAGSGTLDTTYNAYYVTTDASGSFGLTGKYTCTPGAMVYLLATQGNPGLAAGKNNPALAEMTTLGACPTGGALSPTLNIIISEASTVGSVYALAGFMTAPNAVSRANTALAQTGMNNAFATVNNLVTGNGYALTTTPGSGTAAGTFSTTGVAPTAKINLLANILAACINSDGTGMPCSTLFANATSDGTSTGTVPTDTVTAMLNIAHNPGSNVANLFNLVMASGPFQPATATQPNDFTLAVAYTVSAAGSTARPTLQAVSIDATGNVVIPFNNATTGFTGAITNLGQALSSDVANSTGAPIQYAIDQNGYAWTVTGNVNSGVGQLVRYTVASGVKAKYSATLYFPVHMAIDASKRIYVTDPQVSKVQVYNNDGTTNQTTNAENAFTHIQVNTNAAQVTLATTGNNVYVTGNAATGGGLNQPGNLALDSSGAIWLANTNGSNSLSRFMVTGFGASSSSTAISPSTGYTGGGLKSSTSSNYAPVVMDGASNAWYGNYDTGSVSVISNGGTAISPSTGYALADHPEGLAIDGSGNVWVTVANGTSNTPVIYELIGAAVPVATPILPGQFGARP